MGLDKGEVLSVGEQLVHLAGDPGALSKIHPALVEGVEAEHQPVEGVDNGGGELACVVAGSDQTAIAFSAEEHVEELLQPRAGTQTHERSAQHVHEVG